MLLCPWEFPGKSTRVGCHFLLQGIVLTQGLNPGLLHCRQTLYYLSYQGSPNITGIQVYAPTSNAEEAEVEQLYEDLQDLLELIPEKDVLLIIGN